MTRRIWLSWSSGKDSAWSLHLLRRSAEVEVVGLLTTLNEAADRVAMHGVRRDVLRAQAGAAGLPLIEIDLPFPCSNEDYEARMAAACNRAEAEGIEAIAFGDLFLEDIRSYREAQLAQTRLDCLFPAWGLDTSELADEMIDAGLRATLTCVDTAQVPAEFAGRAYDAALLAELPESADPCGENGEFHTLVHAGPMFSHPLRVEVRGTVMKDTFCFADVTLRG